MRILLDANLFAEGPWKRAGEVMGHDVGVLDPDAALEVFARSRPNLVAVKAGCPAVKKAVVKYGVELLEIDPLNPPRWTRPAADCPPNFPGGVYRPEFACDVAYVGHYKESHKPYLDRLLKLGLRVLVFGDGFRSECVGRVSPSEVANVYASAKLSLDLDGSPERILSIFAAGGFPVTVGEFDGFWVDAVAKAEKFNSVCDFWMNEKGLRSGYFLCREQCYSVRSAEIYPSRLAELLTVSFPAE